MDKAVLLRALWILIVFFIAVPSTSYSLTPPNSRNSSLPPVPELIPAPEAKASPSFSSQPDSLQLTAPLQTGGLSNDLPPITKPSSEEIKEKVVLELKELEKGGEPKTRASYDIPIVINDQVEYFIDYFQTKLRNRFSLWMSRSSRYIPMMQKILEEHGLPNDLVYLAMIESGFSTKAYSRAHAAGPWQFIRETGERYGLKINSWVDERKDPIKSTRAAAKHLSDLFNRFGSWYLAAAGYNAGEGKITRALALYNAQNFWEISADHRSYIKEETKQYVPKMIAAALIAKEPEKYGFVDIPYQAPLSFEEASVPGNVELKDVAAACGVEVETIVDLNPELKRWVTPPGVSSYALRLPEGTKDRLMENFAQLIKPKAVVTYAEHRVKKGERLAAIAKKYGVKTILIARANRIKSKGPLKAGLVILIPQKSGSNGSITELERDDQDNLQEKNYSLKASRNIHEKKVAQNPRPGNKKEDQLQRIQYKIKKGETLISIAEKFDLETDMIRRWNPKNSRKMMAGSRLTLFIHKAGAEGEKKNNSQVKPSRSVKKVKADEGNRIKKVLYIVKKGDSLSEIAHKYNTTPDQIRSWNRLSAREHIKPGDKLSLKIKKPVIENI
jgi:membrane-bound lytic murein transglycosylase D